MRPCKVKRQVRVIPKASARCFFQQHAHAVLNHAAYERCSDKLARGIRNPAQQQPAGNAARAIDGAARPQQKATVGKSSVIEHGAYCRLPCPAAKPVKDKREHQCRERAGGKRRAAKRHINRGSHRLPSPLFARFATHAIVRLVLARQTAGDRLAQSAPFIRQTHNPCLATRRRHRYQRKHMACDDIPLARRQLKILLRARQGKNG